MTDENFEVVIIGAGLAGLAAATELERFNLRTLILEKSDRAGGRVKTDDLSGFKLDHGFQAYFTEYPEGKQILDYSALKLQHFKPAALCFNDFRTFVVSDTARNRMALPVMALSPAGTFMDKIRIGNLNARLRQISTEAIFERPDHTTLDYLKQSRYSNKVIERFFRPFFSGIFMENKLETSSRMFEFAFKMMGQGNVSLPAYGMEEIPRQLKSRFRRTQFRFHTEVEAINGLEIVLKSGEKLSCRNIIVATEEPGKLIPELAMAQNWRSTACYYFSAAKSILKDNIIALNYKKDALVHHFTVLTDTAITYAPKGRCLVSVTLHRIPEDPVEETCRLIKNELAVTFGESVQKWEFLKNYHITKALPVTPSPAGDMQFTETKVRDGVYLAGDHQLHGSMNAALKSGRMAAQATVLNYNAQKR